MIPVRKPLSVSCLVIRSCVCLSKGQGCHHCCIHLILLPDEQTQLKSLTTCCCETSPTVEPESMVSHHLCKDSLQTKKSSVLSVSSMLLKPEWSHCAWLMWGSKNPDTSTGLLVKPCWLAQTLQAFKVMKRVGVVARLVPSAPLMLSDCGNYVNFTQPLRPTAPPPPTLRPETVDTPVHRLITTLNPFEAARGRIKLSFYCSLISSFSSRL